MRMRFSSFLRFSVLMGFCVGVGSVPILLTVVMAVNKLTQGTSFSPGDFPLILLVIVFGLLSFTVYGVLGVPIYALFKPKTYSGEFELLSTNVQEQR
jgi:hypothetical protein